MNTKSLLITVLATAFAGAASATSKTPAELQQEAQLRAPSTTTRAVVTVGTPASSNLTRATVLLELNVPCNDDLNTHFLERARCSALR